MKTIILTILLSMNIFNCPIRKTLPKLYIMHHATCYAINKSYGFICTTISGKKIKTEDLRGKIIVLNFWFIACTPCRWEINQLTSLANKYVKDTNVVFISISSMDGEEQLQFVKKKTGFSYQLVASRSDICTLFDVKLYPTNIVLYNGEIIKKVVGYQKNIEIRLRKIINTIQNKFYSDEDVPLSLYLHLANI